MRLALAFLAVLALSACGSSPKTHYFTLDTAPPVGAEKVVVGAPVTVAAVNVPSSLDRRQMVRRAGANAVDISDQDRWTAPLGDMARQVLSRDLAARLPTNMVVPPNLPAPPQTRQIVVSIAQFGPDAHGAVVLDCGWSLLEGAPPKPILRREVSLKITAAGPGAGANAAAMSRLLGRLATRIAADLGARG